MGIQTIVSVLRFGALVDVVVFMVVVVALFVVVVVVAFFVVVVVVVVVVLVVVVERMVASVVGEAESLVWGSISVHPVTLPHISSTHSKTAVNFITIFIYIPLLF